MSNVASTMLQVPLTLLESSARRLRTKETFCTRGIVESWYGPRAPGRSGFT
jgi:hypothetical protein